MKIRHSSLIAFAILLYAAWNASELFIGWSQPHIEKYSWIVFLIWAIPLPLYWLLPKRNYRPFHPILLWSALLVTFFGVIGSVNAVLYLGFAIALAAFLPFQWNIFPWLFSALSWMPAFGWLGLHYFPDYLLGARFLLAIFGATLWIISTYTSATHE